MNIWLNPKQRALIIEALDMLLMDYMNGHPEFEEIERIINKIVNHDK